MKNTWQNWKTIVSATVVLGFILHDDINHAVASVASAITADNVICSGCVNTNDIRARAVTTQRIAIGGVTSQNVNPNLTLGSSIVGCNAFF